MTNKTEAFKRDCRVVNMKCEYPGYTGDIQWMVVSELTEEQIEEIMVHNPARWLDYEI